MTERTAAMPGEGVATAAASGRRSQGLTLFLCGDVMTGRGIDQILPHSGNPRLVESYVRSAVTYVELAERASGPIGGRVPFEYVWGDALPELARVQPDARIVNLETAVTTSEDAWPGKEVHYRMHPANARCLTAAAIDCCSLANNHVLDWGRSGLTETLATLHDAGIRTAGAGSDAGSAASPAVIDTPAGPRVLVFGFASEDSGVPREWRATRDRSGVNLIDDRTGRSVDAIAAQIAAHARSGDVVVASIHWGGNWGYQIAARQRELAHALVDSAGVQLVHGHSSHHPKGIEIYRGRVILYGCGDLLNDYEGIGGYERYRGNLALMYYATVDAETGALRRLAMTPTRTRRFRITRASPEEASWLSRTMDRECRTLGARVEQRGDETLELLWT